MRSARIVQGSNENTVCKSLLTTQILLPWCLQYWWDNSSAVYTVTALTVWSTLYVKRSTHSALHRRVVSVQNGRNFCVFLDSWTRMKFWFSYVATFLASTGNIQPTILFAKQLGMESPTEWHLDHGYLDVARPDYFLTMDAGWSNKRITAP